MRRFNVSKVYFGASRTKTYIANKRAHTRNARARAIATHNNTQQIWKI